MSDYRRYFVSGGTYFFTVKTEYNRPIFREPKYAEILGSKLREAKDKWPFEVIALVLLPDHWHILLSLPPGDDKYSARLGWIKKEFTKACLAAGGRKFWVNASRRKNRRKGIWQRRFWEHVIDDQDDLENHVHYIHWNPVKHGYAMCPHEWPHSTFHRWVERGVYDREWGCRERPASVIEIDQAGE